MTIQELAQKILDECKEWDMSSISLMSSSRLHRLANGSEEDAIFFDNAGGLAFSVWGGEAARAMVEDNYFLKYTYAYRLDGKDVVLKEPFFARETQFVYWNTVKE